jgi:hypothetical protein
MLMAVAALALSACATSTVYAPAGYNGQRGGYVTLDTQQHRRTEVRDCAGHDDVHRHEGRRALGGLSRGIPRPLCCDCSRGASHWQRGAAQRRPCVDVA